MGGTAAATAGSWSTVVQNSRSDEDLQVLMDRRKRKRMISNRESASRSRMRKQKHLEDLVAHSAQLQGENHQLISAMNVATQQYLAVETENTIFRVQIDELSQRLKSLNEIIAFFGSNSNLIH